MTILGSKTIYIHKKLNATFLTYTIFGYFFVDMNTSVYDFTDADLTTPPKLDLSKLNNIRGSNDFNKTGLTNKSNFSQASQSARFKSFMEKQSGRPKYTRYFWEKIINDQPKKDPNQADVDRYYQKLKKTRTKPLKEFSVFELRSNQIPPSMISAPVRNKMKPAPKKMTRKFDDAHFYDCKQPKLTSNLPESFVTQSFRKYLQDNNERMTETIKGPYIEEVTPPPKDLNVYDEVYNIYGYAPELT
ncbi:hypothetical protein TRFO_28499 [Tritrichomonas foetus]|uniref:Uncharacterized protein n=1 Tax=Tritrichomonas foetus TaxID=1144522 RepID=A0A1J4K3J4_9EUKA|nr:hypothetical protein TRFO_28499 [Tritrichomonas foetus]|eukprot:OHT04061.1 hypothetical protein TRFO_28499 [Tritrichomonas foetus]